jgi:hypothetical protein
MLTVVAERQPVSKSRETYARPLAELLNKCLGDTFARQGFASREIVTHWPDIVGHDIAAHAEPVRMQWPRNPGGTEPATLVLRVEGPAAIEIQHQASLVVERVNRFFGWRAVDRLAFRQAPLRGHRKRPPRPASDPEAAQRVARSLAIKDAPLRVALGRLGAAVKRS